MINKIINFFKKPVQKNGLYKICIELDSDDQMTLSIDVLDNENAQRGLAMLIYNGFKEPLQKRFLEYLNNQNDSIFKDILDKLNLLNHTGIAMSKMSTPCVRPLEIFKIMGNS